jgi:hypothetical protein
LPYAWNPLLPVTKGTISLATRYMLAIIPFVIRRRLSSGAVCPGLSGGVALPKLSKLLNQEDALSAPCLRVNSALAGGTLAGRWNAADRRNPSL